MKFDDVVERIRCSDCLGRGTRPVVDAGDGTDAVCETCNGSGIDPGVIDEASGWGTWAISVHDSPGWLVVVNVGMTNPTASERQPFGLGETID